MPPGSCSAPSACSVAELCPLGASAPIFKQRLFPTTSSLVQFSQAQLQNYLVFKQSIYNLWLTSCLSIAGIIFVIGILCFALSLRWAWNGGACMCGSIDVSFNQLDLFYRNQHYTPHGASPRFYKSCPGAILTATTLFLTFVLGTLLVVQTVLLEVPQVSTTTSKPEFEPKGTFQLQVTMYASL
jgi:hypothetical protein